jgi:hypothetical protein
MACIATSAARNASYRFMMQLHPEEILKLEFEYARETAAQAQNDRTVIVNLYLILVGGIGSLLLAAITISPIQQLDIPPQAAAMLFFVLGALGLLTLFKLIRSRQAWFESVRAMNQIKDYYLHAYPEIESAFLWKMNSVPPLGKAWSITFILSVMVVMLDSLAFMGVVHFLLLLPDGRSQLLIDGIIFLLAFGSQILFYFYELRPPDAFQVPTPPKTEDVELKDLTG